MKNTLKFLTIIYLIIFGVFFTKLSKTDFGLIGFFLISIILVILNFRYGNQKKAN